MSRLSAGLARGRSRAEALMLDTCIITRPGPGKGPFNTATGQYDKPERVVVYEGKCEIQIQAATAGATDTSAGDRTVTVQTSVLKLPVTGSEDVAVKDVVEILTGAHDQSLVGRKFTIVARHEESRATARRLPVKEGTS